MKVRGFARKTRRSTKGGSLPKSLVALFFSRASNGSDQPKESGNGSIALVADSDLKSRSRADVEWSQAVNESSAHSLNGNGSHGNGSRLRRDAIVAPVRSKTGLNGDSRETSDRGRTAAPLDYAAPDESILVPARQSKIADHAPRWKRILDITCILLTLPCWLPFMILIMGAIRLTSAGPIIYRQERVGYRGRRFMIFKFRTMHVGAETKTHEEYFAHLMRADCPMAKLDAKGDSRLISCGRVLRASGLDELPQIFNVLRGEMSLVGPRPCLPHEFWRYEAWQQERVNALPGLTGYWQVNGKNKTTFSKMIAMDLFYARNMSVWLDLSIILRTLPVLIGQAVESRKTLSRGSGSAD